MSEDVSYMVDSSTGNDAIVVMLDTYLQLYPLMAW